MIRAWLWLFVPSLFSFILALIAFANYRVNIKLPFPLWLGFAEVAGITIVLYLTIKSPSKMPD